MKVSRRGLFGVLAGVPFVGAALAKTEAAPLQEAAPASQFLWTEYGLGFSFDDQHQWETPREVCTRCGTTLHDAVERGSWRCGPGEMKR